MEGIVEEGGVSGGWTKIAPCGRYNNVITSDPPLTPLVARWAHQPLNSPAFGVDVGWGEVRLPYIKQLRRVGNSTALIIDRPLLEQLNLREGAEVELAIENNRLVVQAHEYASDEEADRAALRMLKRHRKSLEGLAKR